MPTLKNLTVSWIILFFVLYGSHASGGKLYKWTDEKGVIHYSDRIPDKIEDLDHAIQENEVEDIPPVQESKDEKTCLSPQNNPGQIAAGSTFAIKGYRNLGTGFFISPNGYAVTCKHVIEEANDHMAILDNQYQFPVGVISKSDKYDLALILVTTPQKTQYLNFFK